MLERLGRTAARRHRVVIGLWVALAIGLLIYASGHGGQYVDVFTIPGTQSQQASDILQQRFPAANGATAQVVFHAPSGTVTGPAQVAAITAAVADLGKVPGALVATNPTQPLFASNVSPDQTTSYSTVTFPPDLTALPKSTMDALRQATAPALQAGLTVQYGGAVVDHLNQPTSSISDHADDIGLAIAVIILLVALGSVVSMAVPISLALVALLCSSLLLEIVAAHRTVGTVSPILGTMIGLGVGIDYSLFIVSRHRQNLAAGMDTETAAGRALATSGSAVLFAAVAVCLALGGLALIRIPYLTTLGLSAAMYVAVTVAAALTLLPAMLGLLGPHIDAMSIHHRNEADGGETLSARWAHQVARRPLLFCLVSLTILLALAVPLLHIRLALPTDSSAPTSTTQRQAYDQLAASFGPGVNVPPPRRRPLDGAGLATSGAGRPDQARRRCGRHPGRGQGHSARPQPAGRRRHHRRDPDHGTHRRGHGRPGGRPAHDDHPDGDVGCRSGHGHTGGGRHHRRQHRSDPSHRGSAAAVHRRGGARRVRVAHDGVPLAVRAAQGGGHEPAVHRRRLRLRGGGVPVGLGQGPDRAAADGPHRRFRPGDDVRHPLRPVDGLRGVPPEPHQGGLRPHRRQPRQRRQRPVGHGPRHHLGRPHHDLGVPGLRHQPVAHREDDGPGHGRRRVRGRQHRAHDAGARHHGAGRPLELVDPRVVYRVLPHINVDQPEPHDAPATPSVARPEPVGSSR